MLVPGRYRQNGVCFTENPNFKNLERLQGILSTLSCKQWNEILETKMEVSDGFFCEAYDFPLVISQSAQRFFSALESAWPAMHLGGEMHQKGMANMGVLTPDWGLSNS